MRLQSSLHYRLLYTERLKNLYDNVGRFHWSHEFLLEKRKEHIFDETYKKLPQWVKTYLSGYEQALQEQHRKLLVFSYEVKGTRLAIDSTEYRKYNPQYIHKHCSHTGAFAYREDVSKTY